MKKCPKCGESGDGSRCPKCNFLLTEIEENKDKITSFIESIIGSILFWCVLLLFVLTMYNFTKHVIFGEVTFRGYCDNYCEYNFSFIDDLREWFGGLMQRLTS